MAAVDLYLLRVWKRTGEAPGFRAALLPFEREAPSVFSDPLQLADYLNARAQVDAGGLPPATRALNPTKGETP